MLILSNLQIQYSHLQICEKNGFLKVIIADIAAWSEVGLLLIYKFKVHNHCMHGFANDGPLLTLRLWERERRTYAIYMWIWDKNWVRTMLKKVSFTKLIFFIVIESIVNCKLVKDKSVLLYIVLKNVVTS